MGWEGGRKKGRGGTCRPSIQGALLALAVFTGCIRGFGAANSHGTWVDTTTNNLSAGKKFAILADGGGEGGAETKVNTAGQGRGKDYSVQCVRAWGVDLWGRGL